MNTLLIIVTYLAGNALGPTVQTEMMPSKAACMVAAKAVLATVDDMSKTNTTGYGQTEDGVARNGRQVITAKCQDLSK